MSIAIMTEVWKSVIPTGPKMVLLSLADNANDMGECYPSVRSIAAKCSMSERAVQGHVLTLEKMGVVERDMRIGRSTLYCINPRKICTPARFAPPQNLHHTPANNVKTPAESAPSPAESAPITTTKPSEPPKNQNTAPSFLLPDWIPAESWDAFMETRKAAKAKGTDYAKKLIVSQLEKLRAKGHDPVDVINTSIRSGWKDVYEPKAQGTSSTRPASRHTGFDEIDYTKGFE